MSKPAKFISEGSSSTRPPLFEGDNYYYWKDKMELFLRSQDNNMWAVVEVGEYTPLVKDSFTPKPQLEWTTQESDRVLLNTKAKLFLKSALCREEYDRIMECKTAKEIWNTLQTHHQGTSHIKETRIDLVLRKFELFEMNENETIDQMYGRFTVIINELNSLGKKYYSHERIRKLLRCLPEEWKHIVTAITVAKDLHEMDLEDLVGSLKAHEAILQEKKPAKKKMIALESQIDEKSKIDTFYTEEDTIQQDDEEELAFLSRRIQKLMMRRNQIKKAFPAKRNPETDLSQVTCYGCNQTGHYKNECPKQRQRKPPFKKSMMATWDDLEELPEDEEANVCLMAKSETDEIITQKNDQLNDKLTKITKERDQYQSEVIALRELLKQSTQKETPKDESIVQKENLSLKQSVSALEKDISKFVTSTETFENIVGSQLSGCSRHMTGDRHSFLSLEKKDGGLVTFGNNEKASIKDKDEGGKNVSEKEYRGMIGSLLYLAASRPDIVFSVGTPDVGLWYKKGTHFDLKAYCDADYAGDKLERKSTSGACQFLGEALVIDSSFPAQTKTVDHVQAVSNTVHDTVEIEHARQSPVKTLPIGQIYLETIPITCQPLDIQPLNTEHPPHDENRTQQSKPSTISKKSKKSKKSKSVDSSRIRRSNRIASGCGRKPAIDTNVYTITDEDSEETHSDSSPTKSAPDIRTYSRRPSSSKSLQKPHKALRKIFWKPILPGRVFNFNDLINTDHDLTNYTNPLGWTKLFNIKETYYPSLISAFYFNAVVLSEKDQIVSDLKGIKVRVTEELLGKLLELPTEGKKVYGINWFSKLYVDRTSFMKQIFEPGTTLTKDPPSSKLKHEFKMIHNVCLHSIFPRKGSKDKVTHNDMMIMYHLSQQIKLNLPYVLIQHMINTIENENKKVTLPYGMFLTRIFRESKVSFVGEESKNTYTTFTTKNIDRMKKAEDVFSEDHGQKRKREIFEQNANLELLAEVVTTQEDRLENILPTSVPCDKGKEILPEEI
ncbi:hypothetical protein TSUD_178470 [Trifolium subterraneum]|uniref:CCHC-type domain-containing protein n=1 Tax=Trifolium subterraneum TaxID=3900 RepID=A0A2Z6MM36_TRISU|nr:hypothetical protein TSUD_178470 [Trifolium subterraneum]